MLATEIIEKFLRENGCIGLKNHDNGCECFLDKDYIDCDIFGYWCESVNKDGKTDEEVSA
jgi:hypothetical protein